MPRIQQLSQSIVNKIAAGEVVERPASVVKELVENAVDAGATRIDVSITGGGSEMIRVVDNGCGIDSDQLPLAAASHATSKLQDADDLFRVGTLGFRGEALASIGEISRMTLRSRTPESAGGAELEIVGGKLSEVTPCGCPVGTLIEVHNLFFNTPVRRKFLRTTQTELGHISEAFTRIALPNSQVHFTLRHNERLLFDLPGGEGALSRIGRMMGQDLADKLIPVESENGPVRISGYVAHPSQSRGNSRMQYVFLNGRHIRDRALQHALTEAYRGLLMTGRHPIAFLSLEMPPEMVDVNVHPTKLEVRFQDSGKLYSQLLATLRTKFLGTDLTTKVETPAEADPTDAHDEQAAARMRQQVVDWAKGEVAAWPSQTSVASRAAPGADVSGDTASSASGPLELSPLRRPWTPAASASGEEGDTSWSRVDDAAPLAPSHRPRAIQIQNRYLVTDGEAGMLVIDQHALHERVLFEQLRARIESGGIESQKLLVPEPVDLSGEELAAALEHRETLARLGLTVEPFGGETLLVVSHPAMLAKMRPEEVLHGLLEPLMAAGKEPDHRDLLDELLHTMACKAAVKAGDPLASEEIESLLAQRHLVHDTHHCPHGRPTVLVFGNEELDKMFKRT